MINREKFNPIHNIVQDIVYVVEHICGLLTYDCNLALDWFAHYIKSMYRSRINTLFQIKLSQDEGLCVQCGHHNQPGAETEAGECWVQGGHQQECRILFLSDTVAFWLLICPISYFLKTRQTRRDFHHEVSLYGLLLFLTLLDNVLSLDNVSNNHWTMCSIIIGQCVQ